MSLENPIKFGQQIDMDADFGSGVDVGVTYTSSSPTVLSVNASGLCVVEQDVATKTKVFVTVSNAQNQKTVIGFDVVPSAFDLSGLNANGQLPNFKISVGNRTTVE